ncbi:MAG: hypothetical protein OXP71_16360 [Candidatus Poribacteria bacterium]|nr:hypothetical protein [Candidatus Poribacteria bacterium]
MLNTTSWKEKAGLMALGSFFTIVGLMLSPITAEQDKFGGIECELLLIDDETDNGLTVITGGMIHIADSRGGVKLTLRMPIDLNGDVKTIFDHSGLSRVAFREAERVGIGIDKHGGYVTVNGRSKGYAIMGINEKGNGAKSTYDKNGYLLK